MAWMSACNPQPNFWYRLLLGELTRAQQVAVFQQKFIRSIRKTKVHLPQIWPCHQLYPSSGNKNLASAAEMPSAPFCVSHLN